MCESPGVKPVGVMKVTAGILAPATDQSTERGLSMSISVRTRPISTGRFGTSMSARHILGLGCSPIKVARELGSERRKTVRSLSVVGVRDLRGSASSTRGPKWTNL